MRVCKMCGADISSRAASAKYCFTCATIAQRKQVRECVARNKEKINRLRREQYAEKTGRTPAEREHAKQERREERESWEMLRRAFGERFGINYQHVNTMSQLEKDAAEATRLGISYGEYEARKRKEIGK